MIAIINHLPLCVINLTSIILIPTALGSLHGETCHIRPVSPKQSITGFTEVIKVFFSLVVYRDLASHKTPFGCQTIPRLCGVGHILPLWILHCLKLPFTPKIVLSPYLHRQVWQFPHHKIKTQTLSQIRKYVCRFFFLIETKN